MSQHPRDCPPNWDYEDYPNHLETIARNCRPLLHRLVTNADTKSIAQDSRPAHEVLFSGLTPDGLAYFAGNYRGCDQRCLKYYSVGVGADSRVGIAPHYVRPAMSHLSELVERGMAGLDAAKQIPNSQISKGEKLLNIVAFAAKVFESLLTIHPYANGNGHAARFVVLAILIRYGYHPRRWWIDKRPAPDQRYSDALSDYRDGSYSDLEDIILESLE